MSSIRTATLLMHCPDQPGLIASVTDFLSSYGANIIDLEQHVDRAEGVFFMRVNWELEGFSMSADALNEAFEPVSYTHLTLTTKMIM